MPTTVELAGTLCNTTEPAPMRQFSPTLMLPRIFAPAPMMEPSPMVGCRLPVKLLQHTSVARFAKNLLSFCTKRQFSVFKNVTYITDYGSADE